MLTDRPLARRSYPALRAGARHAPKLVVLGALLLLGVVASPTPPLAQDDYGSHGNVWAGMSAGQRAEVDFAAMNMEVTDWGVGIWSMHSPYDVASKADIWSLWKGFVAFFGS